MQCRKTKCYKNMTPYLACAYAEGFGEGEDATQIDQLCAWQYISDTKLYEKLQGFYGRTIKDLLDGGYIKA